MEREVEYEVDLRDIFFMIKKRLVMIVSVTLVFMIVSGLASTLVLKPIYESSTTMMVSNEKKATENMQLQVSDLNLNQKLARTYGEIVKSRTVSNQVIKKLNLNMSPGSFAEKASVSNVKDTEFIKIKVSDEDPVKAALIANTLADTFKTTVVEIMNVDNVKILDKAVAPSEPVSPRIKLNIAIAMVLGGMISLFIVFLMEFLDRTIKTTDDVEKQLGLSVIGSIPMGSEIK